MIYIYIYMCVCVFTVNFLIDQVNEQEKQKYKCIYLVAQLRCISYFECAGTRSHACVGKT